MQSLDFVINDLVIYLFVAVFYQQQIINTITLKIFTVRHKQCKIKVLYHLIEMSTIYIVLGGYLLVFYHIKWIYCIQ